MRARSTCSIPLKVLHTDFWSTSECQRPGAHKQRHVVMNVVCVWPARSITVATSCNNFARCCVEMLRAFGQAFNSALVSESDISSSVPSILRDTNTGRNDSSCLLFLKLTAILPHRSCSLRKKRLKLHELTFCLTFRREKPFRYLLLQVDNLNFHLTLTRRLQAII